MNKLHEEIESWLVSYKKNSVKPATYDRLLNSLNLMRSYPIADMPCDFLECDDIQNYINSLKDDGYARTTLKKQFHLIGAFITYCNVRGTITRPLHKGVKLPKEVNVIKRKREIKFYTDDEQERLVDVLEGENTPGNNAMLLMLETGMRAGEILALGWEDIDWRKNAIHVSKTLVRLVNEKKVFIQPEPKSESSVRAIPMSPRAYDLLERLQEEDIFDNLVFHDENGDPLTYWTLRWWTRKACEQAGVPYYGLHALRHTFATNCYNKGCDVKVLSRLLGHADVSITYNVYIHLYDDGLEEMRNIVG